MTNVCLNICPESQIHRYLKRGKGTIFWYQIEIRYGIRENENMFIVCIFKYIHSAKQSLLYLLMKATELMYILSLEIKLATTILYSRCRVPLSKYELTIWNRNTFLSLNGDLEIINKRNVISKKQNWENKILNWKSNIFLNIPFRFW